MTRLAFYAPLKPPNHPTPSGDRELARSLLAALTHAKFEPRIAATLRSLDLRGDVALQDHLMREAEAVIPTLVATGRQENWSHWLTYHNYYKAPDLLGPRVTAELGIPYLQIESTRARKRLKGPWARYAQVAEDAADHASAICYFTKRDAEALTAYKPDGQKLIHLKPFLNRSGLPPTSTRDGPILSAAMMRPGDKLESYRLIAETLSQLATQPDLAIAGDGKARAEVEAMMRPFPNVTLLGTQDAKGMAKLYRSARLLFWPGVNEAVGMVYLEAQAAGIPVLAQDRPGLRDVVYSRRPLPSPDDGPWALAQAIHETSPPAEWLRSKIEEAHLLPAAANSLAGVLNEIA